MYFTEKELIKSTTASKYKIDNTPTPEIQSNLKLLIAALDDLREFYGKPIIVSSGYRCKSLNDKVGGVKNSMHLKGFAADLQPLNGDMNEFKEAVIKWSDKALFDQLIIERSGNTEWIHFGLYSNKGEQRRQVFNIKK